MMLSLASVFRKTRQATSPTSVVRCKITAEEIQKYKTDTQTLARWLDVSIVKRKGRAFEVDRNLITASKADFFPTIKGSTLTGHEVKFPDYVDADAKLVLFSFKHYGFTLLRSWIDPFVERFGLNSEESAAGNSDSNSEISASAAGQRVVTKSKSTGKVVIMEVCFIEYGFLSMAKGLFVNNIKSQISSAQQPLTAVSFGGVMVSLTCTVYMYGLHAVLVKANSGIVAKIIHHTC